MTKFKQIIGRGTRINEDLGKLFFTILDFRNATDLFADTAFDGDPIRIKPITENIDLGDIIEEEESIDEPIIDIETGEELILKNPQITYTEPPVLNSVVAAPREKIYVKGIEVSVLISRELYFDQHGRPITVSLKDHTRDIITTKYGSLNDFLNLWTATDKKEAIVSELLNQGVLVDALLDAVDKPVDLFDLICYLAYDQPPLTRKERANNVKKRNYFTKYGEQARKVLEALLDKYADEGVENIESMEILRVKPFDEIGSAYEIISQFGGKSQYLEAVKELENELYKPTA